MQKWGFLLHPSAIRILTLMILILFLLIQALTTPRCHARKCAKREKNFSRSCMKNPCYKFIHFFCFAGATVAWVVSLTTFGGHLGPKAENRCERLACLPTDFAGCDVTKFEPNNNNIDYGKRDWIVHEEKHPGKFCSKDATESSEMCGYMCKSRLIRSCATKKQLHTLVDS